MPPILIPGQTCWRIEHARRWRVIIDAADYFVAVKSAMLQARQSIMLVGWDFDTRIGFECGTPQLQGPNRLDHFLQWLVRREPQLQVRVLKWDLGMLASIRRGMMPIALFNLVCNQRLHLRLDGQHPIGAAHHQKVVVLDDAVAFCGGIDMTDGRWDTRAHRDHDPRRRRPGGQPFGPWHDAATVVEGAAATAIGQMVRSRWQMATGEELQPVHTNDTPWPADLGTDLEDVDVAVARTAPLHSGHAAVHEIEALYLAGIHRVQHCLYLESQYLAARRLAEALAARLHEPNGPEIIIVLPQCVDDNWLAHKVMDGARARLLHMLWDADEHARLGVYYPVTRGGTAIYVHAKIMLVDDRLLRVGSSNLNNRSMGFDTECDLAIEADVDDGARRDYIRSVRQDLLSEHLGTEPQHFAAQVAHDAGSVLGAIEALRGPGRSLRPFDPASIVRVDTPLAENELLDPERAADGFGARLWHTLQGRHPD